MATALATDQVVLKRQRQRMGNHSTTLMVAMPAAPELGRMAAALVAD
jgi:hypothetical protein